MKLHHQTGSPILSTAQDPRGSRHRLQGKMLQQGFYFDLLMKFSAEVSLQSLDVSKWKAGRPAVPYAHWEPVTSAGAENTAKSRANKNSRASCIILILRHTFFFLVAVSPAGSSEPFCLTLLLFDGLHKSNFTPPNREQKVWNLS